MRIKYIMRMLMLSTFLCSSCSKETVSLKDKILYQKKELGIEGVEQRKNWGYYQSNMISCSLEIDSNLINERNSYLFYDKNKKVKAVVEQIDLKSIKEAEVYYQKLKQYADKARTVPAKDFTSLCYDFWYDRFYYVLIRDKTLFLIGAGINGLEPNDIKINDNDYKEKYGYSIEGRIKYDSTIIFDDIYKIVR